MQHWLLVIRQQKRGAPALWWRRSRPALKQLALRLVGLHLPDWALRTFTWWKLVLELPLCGECQARNTSLALAVFSQNSSNIMPPMNSPKSADFLEKTISDGR